MELSDEAKIILEKDFTQTDVLYLTDEKRYLCKIIGNVNMNIPI